MSRDACVLVVDDQSLVRMCIARLLESEGYAVVSASDGAHALEILERAGKGVDLVLTDINMPRLNGLELGRRIARLGLAIPVLYMSAELPDALVGRGTDLTTVPFLLKPFSMATLLDTMHRLLTERRSKPPAMILTTTAPERLDLHRPASSGHDAQ